MDTLLKEINLDLRFTAYPALAHSKNDGIMKFTDKQIDEMAKIVNLEVYK